MAATLALLTGAMAAAAGLVRLGFLADLLSRPVLVGYLTRVALIMIAGQLGAAIGVPVTGEDFLPQVASFARHLGEATSATSLITVAALAFLFLMHAQWPYAPGPLLAAFPLATLAALVIYAATLLIDVTALRRLVIFRRGELVIAGMHDPARWFVLNVEANVEVDFTALEALDLVRDELARDGTIAALARVKQDLLVRLKAFGPAKEIGPDLLFPTLPSAVDAYRHWAAAHPPPASQNLDGNEPEATSGADG